jgi:L-galactose dehydrogenase/L-glyceraldehyde 3-phosphate reductase
VERRALGRTGVEVSALGFGCGAVGGLMLHGTAAEQAQAVGRALELGVNYFDTAALYGDGESERNLGRALRAVGEVGGRAVVGTKVRLRPEEAREGEVEAAVARSLEASLERLGRDQVDLFQLHNGLGGDGEGTLTPEQVVGEVVPALDALRRAGKTRFVGITGNGEAGAIRAVVDSGLVDTVQVFFNLLNPSAAYRLPRGFPAYDFRQLVPAAAARGVGVIVVRALAAGALSAISARHEYAAPSVAPISTAPEYDTDLARARLLESELVASGHVATIVEAAVRFPLATDGVSTVLVGFSSREQLEQAARSVGRGPLRPSTVELLPPLWEHLAETAAGAGGSRQAPSP